MSPANRVTYYCQGGDSRFEAFVSVSALVFVKTLVWKAMLHLITGDVGVLVLSSKFRLHHGVS